MIFEIKIMDLNDIDLIINDENISNFIIFGPGIQFLYIYQILLRQMFCMGNNQHDYFQEDATAKKIQNYIFKYQDVLGKGNFGSAYSGFDVNTGRNVAIKVIKMNSIKSKVSQKLLQNEIQILKNIKSHPNVLKCYDVFTSVNNCYIITQLCDHDLQKDLQKKGKFKQNQIRELVYGIYKGLEQLSRNSIIHRDIKVSNIFISSNGTPKIADFGFAVKSSNTFQDLNIGSPLYMSPEGLFHNQYGVKTDVWSFGVLLYELIHGQTPLQRCKSDAQLKQQVLRPPIFISPVSFQFKQMIEACLTVDEKKRPNIFQLGTLPYFRRLFSEIQGRPYSLKDSSNNQTECSSIKSSSYNVNFYNKQISYDNAVSLLHYCRLLHKVNKKYINSQIFSQFLLNLSCQLSRIKISLTGTFNEQLNKLKQVLVEYHNKYLLDYIDLKTIVNPRQVLDEIDKLLKCQTIGINQVLAVLDTETKVLIYSIQHKNPDIFTKNSDAKAIIESGKLF